MGQSDNDSKSGAPANLYTMLGAKLESLGIDLEDSLSSLGHVRRKPVNRGWLAKDSFEVIGIHLSEGDRVECAAESLLEHERPSERFLCGYLLIQRQSDDDRKRVISEKGVGFGTGREVDIRHVMTIHRP